MKDETLLPCPFCGGKPEGDGGAFIEYYGHERQDYSITCKQCGAEVHCDVGDFEGADAACSCHHDTKKICADKWNARAALQPGNSGQVPAGYLLVPVEPTPEMMLHKSGCQYHAWNDPDCPMRETRRLVWSHMLASAPKSPGDQLTPAPEGRLQKAIFNACIVFLYGCGNGYKNHEGHFYDVETEHSFCIWEIAEQIGVVKETGNYKWSLCKEMEDEIEGIYRKYAMRIMEAAPKVKP